MIAKIQRVAASQLRRSLASLHWRQHSGELAVFSHPVDSVAVFAKSGPEGMVPRGNAAEDHFRHHNARQDVVNVASWLQGATRERNEPVIADWATATATDEIAQMMRPLGQVQVRDRTTPVQIFVPAANPASDGREGDDL